MVQLISKKKKTRGAVDTEAARPIFLDGRSARVADGP